MRKWWCFFVFFNDALLGLSAIPPQPTVPARTDLHGNLAADNFQNALQQQTFMSILTSIEERFKALDNIYSMQLARSMDVKLDQYSRKLESLDTKMARLETLVMLSLNKISENISTKNFKDDISRTDALRKMDNTYESITNRLSYMDRKYEANFMKIQEKVDASLVRLERIEDANTRRELDIDAGFSDVIFTIDDFKSNFNESAKKLDKLSQGIFNNTKDAVNLINRYQVETKRSLGKFHDNIVVNLEYIDNKTSEHYKVSDDTNFMLKNMKSELKNDFNNYANKVADMNSDMWKNTDTTVEDLRSISVVVNQTKAEVQNGVRSLTLQIGKLTNKGNIVQTDDDPYTELNKKLDNNFGKILTNQAIFLESCHRLQMDESQIESEISYVLEKLIDMFEKKLSKDSKDIRNFESFLSTHDTRVKRNIHQANNNIIAMLQKSTVSNQQMAGDIKEIRGDLDAIFYLLHNSTKYTFAKSPEYVDIIDRLTVIENTTKTSHNNITTQLKNLSELVSIRNLILTKYPTDIKQQENNTKTTNEKLSGNSKKFSGTNDESNITESGPATQNSPKEVVSKGESVNKWSATTEAVSIDIIGVNNQSTNNVPETVDENNIDDDTRQIIKQIFGSPTSEAPKIICDQNYRNIIDIRGSFIPSNCGSSSTTNGEQQERVHKRLRGRTKKTQKIDPRMDIESGSGGGAEVDYEIPESTIIIPNNG